VDAKGEPVMKDGKQIIDDYLKANALATDNLHWVTNHRLNMMIKFNF
jgi:hypothetical protein